MQMQEQCLDKPHLKDIILEASRALALLDSNRLEELALSCQALNRCPFREDFAWQARQAREAQRDLAVFGRVLDATRANIAVLRASRKSREGRLEYCREEGSTSSQVETSNGNH
jgi:hypothetical protein